MTDPSALARLRELARQWRENAKTAGTLSARFDTEHDDAGNAFAFLKERRVWTTCAVDLEAELVRADPLVEGWRPIATLRADQREHELFFWCVPKTADESFVNTSGEPIVSTAAPYLHRGKFKTWGSLSKATHWQPLPAPPCLSPEAQP